MGTPWLAVPVGINAHRWVTRRREATVLVVVSSVVAGQRLMDVVDLIECDLRVQTVYTQGPGVFGNGVPELLRSLGVLRIPWQQAVQQRFDLVLAAAYEGLHELHGPIMVLPHGAGYGKRAPGFGGDSRPTYGLDAQRLIRDGRVLPASIVLSHESQRTVLARQCPPAAEVAVVAGDPCYDRMLASRRCRARYRTALGVPTGHELVVVASTWGPRSLFARDAELLDELVEELDPARFRVAALVHPAAWAAHGRRQMRAWLSRSCTAGLMLIEPDMDWRTVVLAADHLVGDQGSTTVYAAAIGVPVLHVGVPKDELDPDTPQAWLAEHAPRLDRTRAIEPQLRAAARRCGGAWAASVASRLTSRPGQARGILRAEMYRLLGLPAPAVSHQDGAA
ncbi:MAG TPA: hypothetical protein VF444_10980 [Pseudonocardiaceae bacterium]